jgi:hypothetical protein
MMAHIGVMRALNRHVERVFDNSRKESHWGKRKLKRDHKNRPDLRRNHRWCCDAYHLKVFANEAVAEEWLKVNDPEGVAVEYEVIEGSGRKWNQAQESIRELVVGALWVSPR